MRLWHEELIPYLPTKQLVGQHRECCALRGLGWGKKHSTVDYVFTHPYGYLYFYHLIVMEEMDQRGFKVDPVWKYAGYRGKRIGSDPAMFLNEDFLNSEQLASWASGKTNMYPEHNTAYLLECIENLHNKGIDIAITERKEDTYAK